MTEKCILTPSGGRSHKSVLSWLRYKCHLNNALIFQFTLSPNFHFWKIILRFLKHFRLLYETIAKMNQKSAQNELNISQKSIKTQSKLSQNSVKTQPKISQKSAKTQPKICQKSAKNLPKICQKSAKNQPKIRQNLPKIGQTPRKWSSYCKIQFTLK